MAWLARSTWHWAVLAVQVATRRPALQQAMADRGCALPYGAVPLMYRRPAHIKASCLPVGHL